MLQLLHFYHIVNGKIRQIFHISHYINHYISSEYHYFYLVFKLLRVDFAHLQNPPVQRKVRDLFYLLIFRKLSHI